MKRKDEDLELWDEDIHQFLSLYHLEYPTDDAMDATVSLVIQHMPRRRKFLETAYATLLQLMRTAAFEAKYMHPGYWLAVALFYVAGALGVAFHVANPYVTAFYLSPMPCTFGLLAVFRNQEHGVVEMEAACRFSPFQMLLGKLLLTAAVNVGLNLIFIAFIGELNGSVVYTKLFAMCLCPALAVSATSFIVSANTRSTYASAGAMVVWTAISIWIAQSTYVLDVVERYSSTTSVPVAFFAIMGLVWQLVRMKRRINYEFVR